MRLCPILLSLTALACSGGTKLPAGGDDSGSTDGTRELAERLVAAGTSFVIEPHTRFVGEVGEQSTMFLLDPSGNALEFKAFADDSQVFAR